MFRALTIGIATSVIAAAQTTRTIEATDSRPLAKALDILESISGLPINYEDPPYQNLADVQDVSTDAERAARPGFQLLVPRIGTLTAQVTTATPPSAVDAIAAINLLLANYRLNSLPGDFKIEQANGMLYVIPTTTLSPNGPAISVTSPLLSPVTIPTGLRNVADTAQAILDAVYKATGLRIAIGNFPFFPTETVIFGATAEPARDALARLFTQMGRANLSYRLDFDSLPDKKRVFDYMINLHAAGYTPPVASSPIMGPAKTATQPNQATGGDGPFFSKTN